MKRLGRLKSTIAGLMAALGFIAAMGVARDAMGFVVVRRAVCYRPHPLARAAVVTTAAVGTAVVVGSVVRSLPPSCRTVMVGNVAYQECGGHYYEPRYSGSEVTYVVVNPPR